MIQQIEQLLFFGGEVGGGEVEDFLYVFWGGFGVQGVLNVEFVLCDDCVVFDEVVFEVGDYFLLVQYEYE